MYNSYTMSPDHIAHIEHFGEYCGLACRYLRVDRGPRDSCPSFGCWLFDMGQDRTDDGSRLLRTAGCLMMKQFKYPELQEGAGPNVNN